MTPYLLMCLVHFTIVQLTVGEYIYDTNVVYGLPELTRDILQKIKSSTGQPINTNYFIPLLAASTKGYQVVEYKPYTKNSKYTKTSSNNRQDGGFFKSKKGEESSSYKKDHFHEFADKGLDVEEILKHKYGDHSGEQHKFQEGRFVKKNHHEATGGEKGDKFKKGRKHAKYRVEKGFRDIYHRDEEKKSDYFWKNRHEEGKWFQYGLRKKKTQKSVDKKDEGKEKHEKTKESNYEKKEMGEKKSEESSHEKKEKKCDNCKT